MGLGARTLCRNASVWRGMGEWTLGPNARRLGLDPGTLELMVTSSRYRTSWNNKSGVQAPVSKQGPLAVLGVIAASTRNPCSSEPIRV